MRLFTILSLFSMLLCGRISSSAAGIPQTLNYQGTLQAKTGQLVNEPQDITFGLYTTPVGTEAPFWTDTLSLVPVTNGQFSVTLGATPNKPLDPSKFGGDTYIGIKVGTQLEMTPRQKITSVPYAFNGIPLGGIIMWSGSVVPSGWSLCDGSHGTPNLRDKFIMGAGNTYTIGAQGGETNHTLSANEMPSHDHSASSGNENAMHTHTDTGHGHGVNQAITSAYTTQGPLNWGARYGAPEIAINQTGNVGVSIQIGSANIGTQSANHTHTVTVNANGGGAAHNTLPPYYALAFIMKL